MSQPQKATTERPPEVAYPEWASWSTETRYLFVERLNMEASVQVALYQARENHQEEQRKGRLF